MNSTVSVLGLGNMGAALATLFLRSDADVTVWNRTSSKAWPFADGGAHVAVDTTEALQRSEVVVICLERYAQVRDVLGTAAESAGGLLGRTIVNLTWGTIEEATEARDWVETNGGRYLDGAILDYPANMGPDALILYSGDEAAFDDHATLLSILARARFEGTNPAAANALGMAGALFHNIAVLGFYEAAAYAAHHGIDARNLYHLTADIGFDVCARAFSDGIDHIESGDYRTDQSTIGVHYDTVLIQKSGFAEIGQTGTLTDAASNILGSAITAGHRDLAMSAIYRHLRRESRT
ncbi:3-hydroxyisobutyrate dehydrogenase [Nocardia amikacinitolerans]|uniref:3-hydroxyisobutyrate dehydrogenase n=1 Tax=Nocardia amikacinitolerans TaxID=756689 RepID=A0A285LTX8_9NOCA|nr:3-hydroxyisobutyrate dehydrogenase [Nocardia amikacinitolerans]MCP2297188.1 3-hydroxyisobutyrate dehydrogenase [Nocardia amikacinitolerans]SNY88379.1 3-hydroxyisobutyrate dehydrogenase [Nocardia amikacinitolerans]